jgi:hypothetical protein
VIDGDGMLDSLHNGLDLVVSLHIRDVLCLHNCLRQRLYVSPGLRQQTRAQNTATSHLDLVAFFFPFPH